MNEVVVHVNYETLIRPSEATSSHPTANHLVVQDATTSGPPDDYCSYARRVKTRRENAEVAEHLYVARSKALN